MLPIRGYSKAVSKQLEEKIIDQFPVGVLMAEVARQIANATHELLEDWDLPFLNERRICGLVGGGNNGGDCLLALAFMQARGYHTVAVLTTPQVHAEALKVAESFGVYIVDISREEPEQAIQAAKTIACRCEVWIDGILGLGLKGEVREPLRSLIAELKRYLETDWPRYEVNPALKKTAANIALTDANSPVREYFLSQRPQVVAVDIPSGIHAQDGTLPDVYLPADITVTAGVIKSGALLPPGDRAWGEIRLVELKFPEPLPHLPATLTNVEGLEDNGTEGKFPSRKERVHSEQDLNVLRIDEITAAALCLIPAPDAHKYSRGVVQVVAGSKNYPMTALLVAQAALKTGCGLLRINDSDYDPLPVLSQIPEALVGSGTNSALVAGPGIDPKDPGRKTAVLNEVKDAFNQGNPIVLDAGALAFYPDLLQLSPSAISGKLGGTVVLTPHCGEAARLLTTLGAGTETGGVSAKEVAREPVKWARTLAQVSGASVLLKGRNTIISDPEGNIYSVRAENVGAATAGNGDTLAGIIVSFLANWNSLAKQHGKELDPGSIALITAGAAWVHSRLATEHLEPETLENYLMGEEYNFLTGYLEYKHRKKPSPYASILYEEQDEIPGMTQEQLEKLAENHAIPGLYSEIDESITPRGYQEKWENGYKILDELREDFTHGFENKAMFEPDPMSLQSAPKFTSRYSPLRVSESVEKLPLILTKAWTKLSRIAGNPRESAYVVLNAFTYLPPTLMELIQKSEETK